MDHQLLYFRNETCNKGSGVFLSLSKNENMFYEKTRKKQKDQRFPVERVEQRTSDVES